MTSISDVAIVGGGPAGAVAGLVLARAGQRVVLIEAAGADAAPRVGEALPPAARPLLADLGLLARLRDGGHLPCPGNVSIWGEAAPRHHDFLRDPHGSGWHLDRRRFDASLRDAAAEYGVDVRMTTRARTIVRSTDGWRLTLVSSRRDATGDDPTTLRATWLIDATGRSGALATTLGAQRRRDDPMVALVARFRQTTAAPVDRDARTMIEAVADGWWYSARLPQGERLVAFHTDPDLVDLAALRRANGLIEPLRETARLRSLLTTHGYRLLSPPRGADAGSTRLEAAAGDRWLAVGDAALSLDPLSSQGLLTAAYTGMRGAHAILARTVGTPRALETYRHRLHTIYAAYLEHRAQYYALETRWRHRTFWQRRVRRSVAARIALGSRDDDRACA